MVADETAPKGFSLKRWSRRKLEAARTAAEAAPAPAVAPVLPAVDAAAIAPVDASPAAAAPAPAGDAPALPPIESLTIDSDFTAFLQPKVDEALKRQALKQLFRDPRFNVMDGLDVYIDDYSKPDPISADVVRQMVQSRYIFDPPATRVNEQGVVEDVPPNEVAAARADDATGSPAEAAAEASPETVADTSTEAPAQATAEASPETVADTSTEAPAEATAFAAPDRAATADAASAALPTDAVPAPAPRRTGPVPR